MAEVLECKAAWRLASQGALRRRHGCSGTRGAGKGSGPSAVQAVQAERGRPFCCQHDYSCLMLVGHFQPQLHLLWVVEVWHWPLGVQWEAVWVS